MGTPFAASFRLLPPSPLPEKPLHWLNPASTWTTYWHLFSAQRGQCNYLRQPCTSNTSAQVLYGTCKIAQGQYKWFTSAQEGVDCLPVSVLCNQKLEQFIYVLGEVSDLKQVTTFGSLFCMTTTDCRCTAGCAAEAATMHHARISRRPQQFRVMLGVEHFGKIWP